MSKLRHYQEETVNALRQSILNGHKKIVLCSPTGSGKTVMFSHLVSQHLKKGGKVLILTHRIELLKQAGRDFEKAEEIKAGHEPDLTKPLIIGMCETLYRRLDRYKNYLSTITMLVCDEVHSQNFNKIYPFISEKTICIGASATPLRTGKQEPLDAFYTDMVQLIDTPELIELGFLAKAKTYGVGIDLKGVKKKGDDYDSADMAKRYHDNKIYEGVIENYQKICPGTKAILFASNIESSKEMCLKFNMAGIPAKHLDSEMPDHERQSILKWYRESKNGVLTNISILTTGFDIPDIQTVILYRSTLSLALFLQICGRGARVIPGVKQDFFILDFGNNLKLHNFWEAPRTWSLQKKKRSENLKPAPVKICPSCHAMLPVSSNVCTFCSYAFKKEYGGKNEFAELKLLSPPEVWKVAKTKTLEEKAAMAKEKLIKPMRVLHELKTKEEGLEFIKAMGYKPSFAYLNRQRFKCFESL